MSSSIHAFSLHELAEMRDVPFHIRVRFDVVDSLGYVIQKDVVRSVRQHSGWQSVRYMGARYQLFGVSQYWIRLDHPIGRQV